MSIFRKIARILLLVSGIFGLIDAVGGFFLSIGAFVFGAICMTDVAQSFPDVLKEFGLLIGIGAGVLLLFFAVFSLVLGILGIKGFKQHEKKIYIGNIVFAVLTGFSLLPLAGAILGLIALAKDKKALEAEAPVAEEVPAAE